eukprot:158676_1
MILLAQSMDNDFQEKMINKATNRGDSIRSLKKVVMVKNQLLHMVLYFDQNVDLAYRNVSKSDMEWSVNIMHIDKSTNMPYVIFMREFFFPSNIVIHPGILYGRYLVQANSQIQYT